MWVWLTGNFITATPTRRARAMSIARMRATRAGMTRQLVVHRGAKLLGTRKTDVSVWNPGRRETNSLSPVSGQILRGRLFAQLRLLAIRVNRYSIPRPTPSKSCRLRRSTQHLPEVYSQGSGILGSFAVVDSSAARPGRAALANSQTGQCLAGSIAVTADWCFRSYRAARGSADRRSRPAHS